MFLSSLHPSTLWIKIFSFPFPPLRCTEHSANIINAFKLQVLSAPKEKINYGKLMWKTRKDLSNSCHLSKSKLHGINLGFLYSGFWQFYKQQYVMKYHLCHTDGCILFNVIGGWLISFFGGRIGLGSTHRLFGTLFCYVWCGYCEGMKQLHFKKY